MKYEQIAGAKLMVSSEGAEVVCLEAVNGEVFWKVGLTPGIHDAKNLLPYVPDGAEVELYGGVTALWASGQRVRRVGYGDKSTDSGANPDFVPTRMTDAELRMRKLLAEANATEKRIEKKRRAIERVAAKPEPEPEPEALPEPEATPEPTPEAPEE